MIKIVKDTMSVKLGKFSKNITGLKLNKSIANIALADIRQHFLEEKDENGRKWPALAPITIQKRRKHSDKPLQDTRQMYNSLNINSTTEKEAVVSAVKYDARFNINVPELQNDGGRGFILEDNGQVIEISVPKRQFMYTSTDARKEINALPSRVVEEI